jgi:single-strand DNA-binding protein
VRKLESGRIVANVTLATNEKYMKDGQVMESTEWHNLEMWDQQAHNAEKYFKKGMLLYCEGRIRTDRYNDPDGQEKTVRKISVISYQMIDSSTGSANRIVGDTSSYDNHE